MEKSTEPTGRAIGGHARMKSMSTKARKEQAKRAAEARWSGKIKQATHGSDDHPLEIGDIKIPCYVLEDGRRVLSLGGTIGALGMSGGSAGTGDGDRLSKFVGGGRISPYVSSDLAIRITDPIRFKAPSAGPIVYGYEATILPDLCDSILAARKAGKLQKQQEHIAHQCEILVRGLARVGIIALVDEATGYQRDRARDALSRILEAFIAKELQPWVKTFPTEFYEQMFRLRGLEFPATSIKRPRYFGLLTNNIVYDRLAPGVLSELKRVTPRNDGGRPKAKYFQSLTANTGYSKLKEHIGAVTALMKISNSWGSFIALLDQHYTRYGDTIPLPLDDGDGL